MGEERKKQIEERNLRKEKKIREERKREIE